MENSLFLYFSFIHQKTKNFPATPTIYANWKPALTRRLVLSQRVVKNAYKATHNWHPALTAPINSRLNVVVRSPALFGLGRNGCWPSRGSQLPRAPPFIFSLCCPLNDRTASLKSVACFLFFFSPALSCPSSSPHSPPSLDER